MNDLNPVSSSVRRSLLALSTCVVPMGDAVLWPDRNALYRPDRNALYRPDRNALYWPDGLDVWVRDGQSPFQHVARLTCTADSGVPGEMEWNASVISKEKLPERMNSESMCEFSWKITLQIQSVLTVTILQWQSLHPTDEDENGCFVGYFEWMFRTSLALEIYVEVETGADGGTKKYPGCAHAFKSLRAAESCGITFRLDIPWDNGSTSSGNAPEYAMFFASQCRRWARQRLEEMDARFPVSVGHFRVILFALTPPGASSRAKATSCMVSSVHLAVVAHMVLSSIDRGNDSLFDDVDRVMQRAIDRALEIGAPPQDDAVAQNALRAARILNGVEPIGELHAPVHAAELAVVSDFSEALKAMVAAKNSGYDDASRHAIEVHRLLQLEQKKTKTAFSRCACLFKMSAPHRRLVLKRIADYLGVGYRDAVGAWYKANVDGEY